MARSNGRAAAVIAICALGHLFLAQLAAFVTPSLPSYASRQLSSRVSLAATAADVAAAKEKMTLLAWAANNLAGEGSPQAAAMQAKADAAAAEYEALKNGEAPPAAAAPAAPAPVAAAPAPAAPVAAAAPSAVSDADIADAKEKAKLLTWAAKTLAGEGSPQAPAMQAKADAAVAQLEALKAAKENGQAAPTVAAPATPAPVAAAPAPAAPVAAAVPSAVSDADLAAAKEKMTLLKWAANNLASEGSPQAPAMQAKADAAVAEYEALKQAQATGAPAVAVPAAPAPVAAAPAPAAPVAAAVPSAVSEEDIEAAKKNMQLLTWAAKNLASEGSPQAPAMQAKADAAVATFEAMKAKQLVGAR